MYKKAFTLLEVLLVITLISILIIIVMREINLEQQFGDINNAQRQADILTIYTAINQYRDANSGNLPAGITNETKSICKPNCTPNPNKIDISEALKPYITFGNIPIDPQQEDGDITGYSVSVDNQGRIVVSSPLAENGIIINTVE